MKLPFYFLGSVSIFFSAVDIDAAESDVQAVERAPVAAAAPVVAASEEERLEQLVAPIALYPDALVALILPAATESSDVVLAARFLERGGNTADIETQSWDESVQGLAHYPEVVKWMDENLEWTRQIGETYLAKPEAVMAALQRARSRAQANGVLVNTAQQQVVVEGGYIRIVPAQPDVIYVPRYDPEIIYVERSVYRYPETWVTFGAGFGVGWWLSHDCDWGRRVIVVDHYYRNRWPAYSDWRRHRFAERMHHRHDWSPWSRSVNRPHPPRRDFDRTRHTVINRPAPISGAPRFDRDRDRGNRRDSNTGSRFSGPRDRAGFPVRGNLTNAAPAAGVAPTANPPAARQITPSNPSPGNPAPRDRGNRFSRNLPAGEQRRALRNPSAPAIVAPPNRVAQAPALNPPVVTQPRPDIQSQRTEQTRRTFSGGRNGSGGSRPVAPAATVQPPQPRSAPAAGVSPRGEGSPRSERTAVSRGDGQRGRGGNNRSDR